ncbi:MAG: hypothetical protein K9H58_17625 [Bacteroidales bacterium]|nr:hypothetical protein [Bacteroidales bacterium]
MKYFLGIWAVFIVVFSFTGHAQQTVIEGQVSYLSSQNVYIKFQSTEGIEAGDTLYFSEDGEFLPAIKVNNLSSISCVGIPISDLLLNVGDPIIARINIPVREVSEEAVKPVVSVLPEDSIEELDSPDKVSIRPEQILSGRFSAASYSNFSNTRGGNSQKMRYTLAMKGNNIYGSKFSFDSYISFVHRQDNWAEIQDNVFHGLKIYNLSLKYKISSSSTLWAGRKINPRVSSLGANDGIQFEQKFKSFYVGAIVGSRPDYYDYGFNTKLLQYGAYFGHEHTNEKGNMQNSLALIEQDNGGKTDRRFAYFQHTNSLLKNLFLFGSAELELFKNINNNPQATLNLTNLYVSLRYRIIKQLSVTASYSARKNIIYYETYKSFIDQLVDSEVLNGTRLQVNYRPMKFLSIGAKVGYRFQKNDSRPSRNVYTYVTYSQVPGIKASATVSATILESGYLNGKIYSAGLTKDIIPGVLFAGINFRYIDYTYYLSEYKLSQNTAEFNVTWKVYKKLSMGINYEGTFEDVNAYNRLYVSLRQRF